MKTKKGQRGSSPRSYEDWLENIAPPRIRGAEDTYKILDAYDSYKASFRDRAGRKGKEYWRTMFADVIYHRYVTNRHDAIEWIKNNLPKYMRKDKEIKKSLDDAFPLTHGIDNFGKPFRYDKDTLEWEYL